MEEAKYAHVDSLKALRARRDEFAARRSRLQRIYYGLFGIAILMLASVAAKAWEIRTDPSLPWVTSLFVINALTPLAIAPTFRMRIRDVESDLQDIDFQIDLRQFDVSKSESRAEKVLHINELQLRRYYDMNLSQNSWVFSLGIFCILLGVGIIGTTLYLVTKPPPTLDNDAKLITAVLGGVGAILANFIAAIYLKMNSVASANLAAFHTKLVETHQLLLANLLASRIEDEEKRWDTLSSLAIGLTSEVRKEATKM